MTIDGLPARIRDKIAVDPVTGCWLWTGALYGKGYGAVKWEGRTRRAHRLVYELLVGPIPAGLGLAHKCHTPSCVHPGPLHARPLTNAENLNDPGSPRAWALRTHCPQGHPYDEANTYLSRRPVDGVHRECRTCARERMREQRAKVEQ